MPGKKKSSTGRGLTDQELIDKYEAGPVNVGAVVKKLLNTPPLSKKKKKTSSSENIPNPNHKNDFENLLHKLAKPVK